VNFRPLGDCLLWAFLKIREVAQFFWWQKLCITFYKKGLANILGHFSQSHLVTLAKTKRFRVCSQPMSKQKDKAWMVHFHFLKLFPTEMPFVIE
jgi:hypothetical protein